MEQEHEHHEAAEHHGGHKRKMNKNSNIIILSLIIIVLIGAIIYFKGNGVKVLNMSEARTRATAILGQIAQGQNIAIQDLTKYNNGVYKIKLQVKDSKGVVVKNTDSSGKSSDYFESYMTTDGKQFFVSGIDADKLLASSTPAAANTDNTAANTPATQPATNAPKNDKPTVQLFVMSYCPYGLQEEKGIIPAVQALGNKINFKLEFVSYSMHGQKEVNENLLQYCIDQVAPTKLLSYVNCFANSASGTSDACLTANGIKKDSLTACIKANDAKYKITANYNDKTTWSGGQFPPFNIYKADNDKYGVQGSPTLVVNGAQVDSSRDPASILTTICNAFKTKPAECDKKLASAAPAAGFGGTAGASGSGSGANCAPSN